MSNSILNIKNMSSYYGDCASSKYGRDAVDTEHIVLRNINMNFIPGEIVTIVGPNGCGKTTLLNSIVQRACCTAGSEINYYSSGRKWNLAGFNTERIINLGIRYLLQENGIFPNLTIEENLKIAYNKSRDKQGFRIRCSEIFDIFDNLKDKRFKKAGLLSGGENKALAMAMVLVKPGADLILLDEPTAGLSSKYAESAIERIERINSKLGITFIVVEQDLKLILDITHKVYILKGGLVCGKESSPKKILDRLTEIYYY